jgi:hypothetical protein
LIADLIFESKTVLNDRERSLEELIGRSLVLAGALAAGVGLLDNSLFDGIIRAIDSMLCDKVIQSKYPFNLIIFSN